MIKLKLSHNKNIRQTEIMQQILIMTRSSCNRTRSPGNKGTVDGPGLVWEMEIPDYGLLQSNITSLKWTRTKHLQYLGSTVKLTFQHTIFFETHQKNLNYICWICWKPQGELGEHQPIKTSMNIFLRSRGPKISRAATPKEYMSCCLASSKPVPTRNLKILWKLSRVFFITNRDCDPFVSFT